jgi:hypothetical protein
VDPDSAVNYLALQFNTADAGQRAAITVGGASIDTVTVSAEPANGFYWAYLALPDDVLALANATDLGPHTVTVQLNGTGETTMPRLFGIKTLKEKPNN